MQYTVDYKISEQMFARVSSLSPSPFDSDSDIEVIGIDLDSDREVTETDYEADDELSDYRASKSWRCAVKRNLSRKPFVKY